MAPYVDRPMTPSSQASLQGAFQSHEALAASGSVGSVQRLGSEPALAPPTSGASVTSLTQTTQNPEYRDMEIQLQADEVQEEASAVRSVAPAPAIVVPDSEDDENEEPQGKGKAPAEEHTPEVRCPAFTGTHNDVFLLRW